MSDYPIIPAPDPVELNVQLLEELQQMQRTGILCTIAVSYTHLPLPTKA